MTTEKMNVHKALSELKVLDKRISDSIDNEFVIAIKHSSEKIKGVKIDAFKGTMKSNYQKVKDLIARRNALKKAVVLSNANTIVNVNGIDYTVAEAIDMKNHGMEYFKLFRDRLVMQYNDAQIKISVNSGKHIEEKAEKYIVSIIQNKSESKIDTKLIEELRAKYIENNTFDLIDPNNVLDEINRLNEMIDNFESDIDSALSVSNAITIIEFEY